MNDAERRLLWDHAHIDPAAVLKVIQDSPRQALAQLERTLWAAYEAGFTAGESQADDPEDDDDDETDWDDDDDPDEKHGWDDDDDD